MGVIDSRPCPCPMPFFFIEAELRAGVGNRGWPLWLLQPDPQAGRARARASGGGAGRRVGFQREPLGTSVERADAAASHGPGASAARPPLGLQLPPPPTQNGWGRGGAATRSQATLGLWGH